ncbi:MAG: TDP-N-acetylfucosamine:lipid II N-acetylfucosaminyltransferase [Pseudomonadota bacterium]
MPDHAIPSHHRMPPLIHVATDEKFVDMGFREFEAIAPGRNRLIIPGGPRPLRHVKSPQTEFASTTELRRLLRTARGGPVIFHSLPDAMLDLLPTIPRERCVLWIGWGYDYYSRLLASAFPHGLLLPQTLGLMTTRPRRPLPERAMRQFRRHMNALVSGTCGTRRHALARVDYFSPVLETEFGMAHNLNPWFQARHLDWNYGTLDDFALPAGVDLSTPGNSILIGNSATPENNHLEIFDLLAQIGTGNRRIVVPLSYGDDWYRDRIIEAGQARFGTCFTPLVEYMPGQAYASILADCGHAFMNHLRQQALGNICTLMLRGASIYMHPASPLYQWLRSRGGQIGSIGEIRNMTACALMAPLTEPARAANRALVEDHYAPESRQSRTRAVIIALYNHRAQKDEEK